MSDQLAGEAGVLPASPYHNGGTAPPGDESAYPAVNYQRLLSFDLSEFGSLQISELGSVQLPPLEEEQAPPAPPFGYNVLVNIVKATNLPAQDWWNGLADPYLVVRILVPGLPPIPFRTRTAWRDLNPHYDEFFELGNLPEGVCIEFEVWDKDLVTKDDLMGRVTWTFAPQQAQVAQAAQQAGSLGAEWHHQWQQPYPQQAQQAAVPAPPCGRQQPSAQCGRLTLGLQLQHPTQPQRRVGQLDVEVCYQPATEPGSPRMLGPVRFRQHLSPTTGWLLRRFNDDRSMGYSTYKLYMCHIQTIWKGVRHPWNRDYANAKTLFNSAMILSGVRSQHSALYATQLGTTRIGVLRDAADFFVLFNYGVRKGERRYFTYTLMEDSFRCSETGAKFFADMFSKHAMHAGAEEEVLYAGEFCIVPDAAASAGYRLVIDNNSGTYAPAAEHLPRIRQLFEDNFPGMKVETIDAADPRLQLYHQQAPSRLKPADASKRNL